MDQEVKDIITEWIYEIYKLKNFNNVAERNIWEAEVKEKWDQLDSLIGGLDPKTCEEYEEEIEELEDRLSYAEGKVEELADKNCELCEENEKLWDRLKNISKVVNDTWC